MPGFKNLKDMNFGKLKALKMVGRKEGGRREILWLCSCECGGQSTVTSNSLTSGNTKSCGCLRKNNASKLNKFKENQHGFSRESGNKKNKLYRTWCSMRNRCFNKNNQAYKYYGGKNIVVCEEWSDYVTFHEWAMKNGYKEGLSIERIDVNDDYSPSNCKWATVAEQNDNKSTTLRFEIDGVEKTLAEWCRFEGMNYNTVYSRIKGKGWDYRRAIKEKPLREKGATK